MAIILSKIPNKLLLLIFPPSLSAPKLALSDGCHREREGEHPSHPIPVCWQLPSLSWTDPGNTGMDHDGGGGGVAGGTAPPVGDQLGPSLGTTFYISNISTLHPPPQLSPVLVFFLPSIRCLLPPSCYPLSSFKNLHLFFSAQPHAQQPIHESSYCTLL